MRETAAGHLMEKIATLDNLYLAFKKARRGKQAKAEVREFVENFDSNIMRMRQEILDGTIAIGEYRFFKIRDPKERMISAAPFSERVLQHAIMNICHDYFDRTLIDTTFATRKGKGLYAALDKAIVYEAQSALDHIKGDRNSIDYWENAKQEALTESKKNDIFIDGINAKLEIIEKYRK